MKQLILVRHAKSSWDDPMQKDFDRPLNERGYKDAVAMAKRLVAKKIEIDAFVSSTANRALTTATYFAEAYGVKKKDIVQKKELYHASSEVLLDVISGIDDALHSVAIFSHNPGITEFATDLTNTSIDNIPTCGIFAIKLSIKHWKDFESGQKKFWFFDYPKNG